ncbi:MAG: hypothetical protein J6X47_10885 [Clostridia bacterium]|nr:hypothetical protein [Clostridia bacterium]
MRNAAPRTGINTEKTLTKAASYAFPIRPAKIFPKSLQEYSNDLTERNIKAGMKIRTSHEE